MTVTRWNRCRPDCGCDGNPSKFHACKCNRGCLRGRDDRKQLLAYAIDVLASFHGRHAFVCPLTGLAFPWEDSEVDRITPSLGYIPGNVILTSRLGNSLRGILQSDGTDLPRVTQYRLDVLHASASVRVTRKCHLPTLTPRNDGRDIVARRDDLGLILNGPYGY